MENKELSFKEVKDQILQEINKREYNVPYWFILSFIENTCINNKWSYSKTSKVLCDTSYGLKHIIEDAFCDPNKLTKGFKNGYCANNWVKLALYELGFALKNTRNTYYNSHNDDALLNDIMDNKINFYYKRNKYDCRDISKVWKLIEYKK